MLVGSYEGVWEGESLVVPPPLRGELARGLVITRGLERCLWVYPIDRWSRLLEELEGLPFTRRDGRALSRLLLAQAQESRLDEKGRLPIAEELRRYAGLGERTIIIGLDSRLEVWDAQLWKEINEKMEEESVDISERVSEWSS